MFDHYNSHGRACPAKNLSGHTQAPHREPSDLPWNPQVLESTRLGKAQVRRKMKTRLFWPFEAGQERNNHGALTLHRNSLAERVHGSSWNHCQEQCSFSFYTSLY